MQFRQALRNRGLLTFESLLAVLAMTFIITIWRFACDDALILNLYFIAVAGVAYALIKRTGLCT